MIGRLLKNSIRSMSESSGKGVSLTGITSYLDSFAPNSLAENWDNTGLLVQPVTPRAVESVLLTNDLTEDVMAEAIQLNVGLIISYHPPIFKPLMRLTTDTWKERVIGTCLENRIAVYSPHTRWDSINLGVNDWLTSAFDIESKKPIVKSETDDCGAGRFCKLQKPIKISEAVDRIKKLTSLKNLGLTLARGATLDTQVTYFGVCAGSGGHLLEKTEVQLYITGEMSHHSLLDAMHKGTSVILCNHSNSERGFLKEFAKKLEAQFKSDIQVYVSKEDRDPIQTV